MLQRVIISVQENIIPGLQSLLDDLIGHGVDTVIADNHYISQIPCGNEDSSEKSDSFARPDSSTRLDSPAKPDVPAEQDSPAHDRTADQAVLCITDSESLYHSLRQQGRYVLPYRHARNSNISFAGALYVIEQIEEIDYETIDMAYRRLAGLPWEILTTERCIVRETTVEDVDSFYQIYAEPEITEYMENLYDDRDEEIAYIKNYQEKVYSFYGYGMWTVLTKDGTVIGRAGISWREGSDLPELGFVIGVPWQRQGYAYEVCSAILDYARRELGMAKIQALVMQGNRKSLNLCRKLGFQYVEQRIVDSQIYTLMICRE